MSCCPAINDHGIRQTTRITRREGTLVALLLAAFILLGLNFICETSATFDEPGFLHAGISNLTAGAPKRVTANLILAENWMALPMLFQRPELNLSGPRVPDTQRHLDLGARFLYNPNNDWRWILRSGRIMNLAIGVVLGLLAWRWSRELFGAAGAFVSLSLYCLSPVVISNSSLATVDVMASLWFLIAARAWWRMLGQATVARVIGCGAATGLLAATKINSLLLAPIIGVMIVSCLVTNRPLELAWAQKRRQAVPLFRRRLGWHAALTSGALLVAFAVLWLCYVPQLTVFRAATSDLAPTRSIATTPADSEITTHALNFLENSHLLPGPYITDLKAFAQNIGRRRGFLAGEYSLEGWWYFFPLVWLLKAPLTLLAGLGLALVALVARPIATLHRAVAAYPLESPRKCAALACIPLLALIVVYAAASMTSALNIGVRHLLPIFPPLFILAGASGCALSNLRRNSIVIAVLALGSAAECWAIGGRYLTYVNPLFGGAHHGHRYVIDSSYDWGQDLPALERWLEQRQARPGTATAPVFFSYFGNADLQRFQLGGITLLPQYFDARFPALYELQPGDYVISATMLHSAYGPLFGPWRESYEAAYQQLAGEYHQTTADSSAGGAAPSLSPAQWNRLNWFDHLRFNRLCAYLRTREPDACINHSLLIFHLDAQELRAAQHEKISATEKSSTIRGAVGLEQKDLDFLK